MKDIKGFSKLFKINIPYQKEWKYYIDEYSKFPGFEDIKQKLNLYQELEDEIDIFSVKKEKSNEIIKFIKNTKAYGLMNSDNNIPSLYTNKTIKYQSGFKYISIDIKKANYKSIKKYNLYGELPDSYDKLLDMFDVPELFKQSKSFRQFIFGNLNPKRQRRVQRNMVEEVIKLIGNSLELHLVSHDEVIYKFEDYSQLGDIVKLISDDFRYTLFYVDEVEDFKIRNFFDISGNFIKRDLFGCPGNRFILNTKKYITNGKLDLRDFYFVSNDRLAIWNDDKLKSLICK